MYDFAVERQKVLRLTAEAATLARERNEADSERQLGEAAEALEMGRLKAAVVGEFKRGKSTLLNALIEEPDLLPVNVMVTTNLVTTVTKGPEEKVVVHLDDPGPDGRRKAVPITRDQIAMYATEQDNPDNVRRARLLSIELPTDRLDGLALVDTPGVGGLNTEHTAATYAFLTSADIVIFVLDALTPLSTDELDFAKVVVDNARAVIFVVTKTDQVADYQVVVDNTRRKLAAVLGTEARIVVVPVSSIAKLDYLETGDAEALEISNFVELESELWSVLRERGAAMLLLRALGVVASALDRLIAPLRAELEGYRHTTEAERDAAERRLVEEASRAELLRATEATWRRTLSREWRTSRTELEHQLTMAERALRRQLVTLVDDERLLREPSLVISLLDQDLALLTAELRGALQSRTAAIARELAEETGLQLNPVAPDVTLAANASAPDLGAIEALGVAGERAMDLAKAVPAGASVGSTAGAVVGALLFTNPIGWAALALLGGGLGATQMARARLKHFKQRDRTHLRSEVTRVVGPYLEECLAQIRAGLQGALGLGENALEDDFEERLRSEQQGAAKAVDAIRGARLRTEEEAAERTAALTQPLAALERLREEAELIADTTLSGGRASLPA